MTMMIMTNYQTRFGKHNLGIHFEEEYKYFKHPDRNRTPMYDHKIIDAWPIDKHSFYPIMRDELDVSDKLWEDAYLPRITQCLYSRFKNQNKSKSFIESFFSSEEITIEELEKREAIEYGSIEIEEVAKDLDIIKPNFDSMVKADLFKWLVSHDQFDLNVDNKKDELVEKCLEIWEELNPEPEAE